MAESITMCTGVNDPSQLCVYFGRLARGDLTYVLCLAL
jgi:hypothetical protein